MLLGERLRLQILCARFWNKGISKLVMPFLALSVVVTIRPLPVVTAETPASEQNEIRAKLPISHDTPDDHIVAQVGSELILVSDIKAFMAQVVELKGGGEIKPDQLEVVFQESARPILKHLVEMKLVSNDAIHTIPAEGMERIRANIDDDFDKKQLPEMMKHAKAATRQELEAQLRRTYRSLEWERRAYFETQIYYGWIQQQIKGVDVPPDADEVERYRAQHPDEKQYDILEKIKTDRRERLIKQYLDRLRRSASVWTVFDDQPHRGFEGTPEAKTDSPNAIQSNHDPKVTSRAIGDSHYW